MLTVLAVVVGRVASSTSCRKMLFSIKGDVPRGTLTLTLTSMTTAAEFSRVVFRALCQVEGVEPGAWTHIERVQDQVSLLEARRPQLGRILGALELLANHGAVESSDDGRKWRTTP